MSEKITSTFTLYGNKAALELEQEIIRRFKADYDKGNDKYTSVTRILYGLDQDAKFDGYELLGAYQCMYFGSTHQLQIQSAVCPPFKLHDHIVNHMAKIDPKIVVQMDYIGNTPSIVGTRFLGISDDMELLSAESEEELNYWFCDEDEMEEMLEDLREQGQDDQNVMSHQRLDEITEEMKQYAYDSFISSYGYDIKLQEPKSPTLF